MLKMSCLKVNYYNLYLEDTAFKKKVHIIFDDTQFYHEFCYSHNEALNCANVTKDTGEKIYFPRISNNSGIADKVYAQLP